jgi:glycerophosphoryl diester phosphodiesterase
MRVTGQNLRGPLASIGLLVSVGCLQATGATKNVHQCRLTGIRMPTANSRMWLPTGVPHSMSAQIMWAPPPDLPAECFIFAASFDTSVVAVDTQYLRPGVVAFLFSGRHAGSTNVEFSLGTFNPPRIRTVVTDSLTIAATAAHRGAGLLAPENTLSALALSARYPVPALEFDVRLTADSIPILMHDAGLFRTTGDLRVVSRTNYDVIRTLNAARAYPEYPAEPPPTLAQALTQLSLTAVPLVFAEIKDDATFTVELRAAKVLALVQQSGIAARVVIYSASRPVLQYLRSVDAGIRLGYIDAAIYPAQLDFLRQNHIEYIFYPIGTLVSADPAWLAQLRTDGIKIATYTMETAAEADSIRRKFPGVLLFSDEVPALFTISPQDTLQEFQ